VIEDKRYKFSIIRKLRKEAKITEEFEIMLSGISLEDLIALKCELSTRSLKGRYLGFPLWKNMSKIIREASLKYAISSFKTKSDAARFLGLTRANLNKALRDYKIEEYFEEND